MGAEKHCRRQRRQASQRTPAPQVQPVPPPAQARGCKGRSPLHEITLIPPLPAGKGGGGIGAKSKAKGRVCRRHRRQAPLQAPQRQGQPIRQGFSHPAGDRAAPRRKKVRRRGANFQIPIDREAKRCYNVSTSAKGFFVVSGNLRHKSDTLPSQREVHGPRPGTRRRGQIF